MKNYQATRTKIKNYITALKERFSTTEWREFDPNEFCKEFKVSFILPQILKKEEYYNHQYKDGKSFMKLSLNIMMANEVTIHNKLREYCNKSAKKIALKKKKIKAKNVVQPKFNFNKKERKVKVMSVSVGLNFYNSVIDDCKNKGITVSQWMFNKLGASENVVIKKTKNVKPELFKKAILQVTPKKRGRPISILKDRVYNEKNIYTIESAENKIKSLETIMNLFTNGVINNEELQSLKVGILNK
jgi:dGTP triphosphohydrolase